MSIVIVHSIHALEVRIRNKITNFSEPTILISIYLSTSIMLSRIPKRLFSVSCRNYVQILARSTLNTSNVSLSIPTSFAPKSLLLTATPSVLPQLFSTIEDIHSKGVQVVVAGVDTIPLNSRSGVSELWLDEKLGINTKHNSHSHSHSHTDISTIHTNNNWESTKGLLALKINDNAVVEMQLASTLFSTGHDHTLFYLDDSRSGSGELVSHLEVSLPSGVVEVADVVYSDRWTPLYEGQTFTITNCVGNLVKQVDKKSASSYLEKNNLLMDLGSKDTQVYVKIHKKADQYKTVLRYEIIAGGGGWGAKAEMLALTPHADIAKGDRIEFFMLTPTDRFISEPATQDLNNNMVFECSHEELSYSTGVTGEVTTVSSFGCGSEKGFKYKGVAHASSGEKLSFPMRVQ